MDKKLETLLSKYNLTKLLKKELTKIDLNEQNFKSLLKKANYNSKGIVILAGAGTSMAYKLKSWEQLSNIMIKHLYHLKKIDLNEVHILSKRDPKQKITIAKSLMDKEEYTKILKENSFYEKEEEQLKCEERKILDSFEEVSKETNVKFITTNIDCLIEKKINILSSNILTTKNFMKGDKDIKDIKLFKIHGCASEIDDIVFTPKEYIKFYGDESSKHIIKNITNDAIVILIGKELETEIVQTLMEAKEHQGEYYIFKAYQGSKWSEIALNIKHDLLIYEEYGIKLLPYLEYIDLVKYFDELVKKNLNVFSDTTLQNITNFNFEKLNLQDTTVVDKLGWHLKDTSNITPEAKNVLLNNSKDILNNSKNSQHIWIEIFNALNKNIITEDLWEGV